MNSAVATWKLSISRPNSLRMEICEMSHSSKGNIPIGTEFARRNQICARRDSSESLRFLLRYRCCSRFLQRAVWCRAGRGPRTLASSLRAKHAARSFVARLPAPCTTNDGDEAFAGVRGEGGLNASLNRLGREGGPVCALTLAQWPLAVSTALLAEADLRLHF
jgi:hypothetical protein